MVIMLTEQNICRVQEIQILTELCTSHKLHSHPRIELLHGIQPWGVGSTMQNNLDVNFRQLKKILVIQIDKDRCCELT